MIEETFTDQEFCKALKIDRSTSARWREQKLVGYIKMPNGTIRYKFSHIQEFIERYEKDTTKAGNTSREVQRGRVLAIR